MSAGRRHRRGTGGHGAGDRRWQPRTGGVELSAETRGRVAAAIAAHDDPSVSVAEFVPLAAALASYLDTLPEPERVEAALQIGEHSVSNLVGRRVRAAGVWTGEVEPSRPRRSS